MCVGVCVWGRDVIKRTHDDTGSLIKQQIINNNNNNNINSRRRVFGVSVRQVIVRHAPPDNRRGVKGEGGFTRAAVTPTPRSPPPSSSSPPPPPPPPPALLFILLLLSMVSWGGPPSPSPVWTDPSLGLIGAVWGDKGGR